MRHKCPVIYQVNRFFVEPWQVGNENIEIADADDIKHISKVLRLKAGDMVEISDSVEFEYLVEIVSMDSGAVVGKIIDKQAFRGEVDTRVTLFQCLPKQGKMETIIQKSVELGVYKIVPVFCDRTVVKDKTAKGKQADNKESKSKTERWNKVSAEAVKQCKRGIIPSVEDPVKLTEMLESLEDFDLVLFPYENEKGTTMKTALQDMWKIGFGMNIGTNIALIIGPEGGFSDEEARLIIENGGKSLSLGKTVLRTETAGPAALAMIMYELEL